MTTAQNSPSEQFSALLLRHLHLWSPYNHFHPQMLAVFPHPEKLTCEWNQPLSFVSSLN